MKRKFKNETRNKGSYLGIIIFSSLLFISATIFIFNIDKTSINNIQFTSSKISNLLRKNDNIETYKSHNYEKIENSGSDKFIEEMKKEYHQPSHIITPHQSSSYAYVTLISGIDTSFKYRGFLYNAIIVKKALNDLNSKADFIALIGYSVNDIMPFESDMDLLKSHGIILYILPRLIDASHSLSFAEMALLKITPYSFIQYERIQFFDGDVMPTKDMDCFFKLDKNAFTVGAVSPLNSGWYLGIPNMDDYNYLKERAIWRLGRDWDIENGWGVPMPSTMTYRGGKPCLKWEFNGADMDQGLFANRFVVENGNSLLIDTDLKTIRYFNEGIIHEKEKSISLQEGLSCCNGLIPTSFFAHFTGRGKPWMMDLIEVKQKSKNKNLLLWIKHLDSLKLSITSENISKLGLGSPLGFFNAKFPKGGYK